MNLNVTCPRCRQIHTLAETVQAMDCVCGWTLTRNDINITTEKKSSIESEARTIIQGDRRDSYGPAKQSFRNIALTWTAHLSQAGYLPDGKVLGGNDVAIMMAAFKLLRESAKPKRDNLVDAIGYVLLAEEISTP